MYITVELLFDQEETFDNVSRIDKQGDFLVIYYQKGDRQLEKVYLTNQVINIKCRV